MNAREKRMRRKLLILSVLFGLLDAVPTAAVKVYRTKSDGLADVKVYETSSEGLADCIIYVVHSEGLASGNGKWYYVKSEGLADVKIYFTNSEGLADKKIFFTKSEGLAKCDVDWTGYKKSMAHRIFGSRNPAKFSEFPYVRDLILAPANSVLSS